MRLEDKFFNSFFYLFLAGITLSLVIVSVILCYYSDNFLDKRVASDIYHIEKKYAHSNIKSMIVLLSDLILKLQVALKEELTLYLDIAKEIKNNEDNLNLDNFTDIYSLYDIANLINNNDTDFMNRFNYISFWFLNPNQRHVMNLTETMRKQLYAFSLMTQSLHSIVNLNYDDLKTIYFLFEGTDIFLAYPFSYFHFWGFLDTFDNYSLNPSWCTDEEGEIIAYYKFRCRDFYRDIISSQKDIFDLRWNEQKDRKLFITSPYPQFGKGTVDSVFTICIKFNDIISESTAYICGDSENSELFESFDKLNDNLIGYVAVTSVGFNEAFYFPQILSGQFTKTLGEFIYRIDNEYFLGEKTSFLNVIQKYMTSNYIKYINEKNIDKEPLNYFDELFIDQNDGKYQRFYINKKEYYYSLFPIIIENFDDKYEHILSIIYIYNKDAYYKHMMEYQLDSYGLLIFQMILFFFFGSVLLYIITLSFKLLAKFIVIPIKNVHYMLEGINVGGEYRLEYLNELKKKQEDNLVRLNKINHQIMQNNRKNNTNLDLNDLMSKDKDKEKDNNKNKTNLKASLTKGIKTFKKKENDLTNLKEKVQKEETKDDYKLMSESKEKILKANRAKTFQKTLIEDEKLNTSTNDLISNDESNLNNLDEDEEYIDTGINYEKKYDADGVIIEKELNFYDFDEELLRYRPVEIDNLVQSLLNLKSALMLTSQNQEVENIIGYTNSEYTFSNFKNISGSRMCQSNIGNLISRLAKYDKAIYHLALSLQNVDSKKFFSNCLTDEFDESDSLLHKIEMNYKKNIKERNMNKLVKKQQRGKTINFSQKIIEVLINARYNKLINIYFRFFSFIQKTNCNYEKLSGYFMHTSFHTINYYHKIIIQYIYLCFISNDLVKIGESILDYIEFLIKFKLKSYEENAYILNINNKDIPEIKEKQQIKRKYFDKIINWINLFECYAKQINDNSALGNYKNVLDAYTHNIQSNHNQFDSGNESASVLLFQINLQRYDFLRGKFALVCREYNDALGFMINAAKKKRIVFDGLIKKRALKHIAKIAEKVRKAVINNNYSKLDYLNTFEKDNVKTSKFKDDNPINIINLEPRKSQVELKSLKLIDKISEIIEKINNDINETNEKQLKDIIVLIDCNSSNKVVIDSYIDVTKTIVKNYSSNNDRIGVFFLKKEYRIICPMIKKESIDIKTFSEDLDTSLEKLLKKEKVEYNSFINKEIQEKIKSEGFDSIDESAQNSDSDSNFNENREFMNKDSQIEDTIKSINYCLSYLRMKEISTNENFFIFFSSNIKELMYYLTEIEDKDYLNNLEYESNQKDKIKIQREKKINFLLVGKFKPESEEVYKSTLVDFFGEKSEVIPYDNMKKIKSILSSNNIINDNITFPNEVYK